MQKNIIDRLFQSLAELENAITRAKATIQNNANASEDVVKRLNSYSGILQNQRELASDLCYYINQQNWDEVNRHVSMINCLSSMIRDDAREVLSSLSLNSDISEKEQYNRSEMLMN